METCLKVSIPSHLWEKFWRKSQISSVYENVRKITAKHVINGTSMTTSRSKYRTSRRAYWRAREGTETFLQAHWKHRNSSWKDNCVSAN